MLRTVRLNKRRTKNEERRTKRAEVTITALHCTVLFYEIVLLISSIEIEWKLLTECNGETIVKCEV